jgi:hypothetical protein
VNVDIAEIGDGDTYAIVIGVLYVRANVQVPASWGSSAVPLDEDIGIGSPRVVEHAPDNLATQKGTSRTIILEGDSPGLQSLDPYILEKEWTRYATGIRSQPYADATLNLHDLNILNDRLVKDRFQVNVSCGYSAE